MVDFQQLKDKNIDRNGGAKRSYRLVNQKNVTIVKHIVDKNLKQASKLLKTF